MCYINILLNRVCCIFQSLKFGMHREKHFVPNFVWILLTFMYQKIETIQMTLEINPWTKHINKQMVHAFQRWLHLWWHRFSFWTSLEHKKTLLRIIVEFGFSKILVHDILKENLRVLRVAKKFISKLVTEEHKHLRLWLQKIYINQKLWISLR